MRNYIFKRLLHSIFLLFGVTLIVFIVVHLSGDPTALLLPPDATKEDIATLRHELGFDKALYVQYLEFLKGILHGDFGLSIRQGVPAFPIVLSHIPATAELTAAALIIALAFAIPIGVYSSVKPNSFTDNIGMIVVLLGQSVPAFWSGLMLIFLFTVTLHLLPAYGRGGFDNLIMPAVSLGFFSMARIARVTRSSMIGILGKDYIRTAKSKGLSDYLVTIRHAFKNAAIPVITMVGMEIGRLLGGVAIMETVFAWPGVGRLVIQAIYSRDFPVVQAAVFTLAMIFLVINFIVDILYTYLDPRVRYD